MDITVMAHIKRLESDNADLRAANARLQALCDNLAHISGQQQQEIARLRGERVDVPILGTLDASTRIPQP